MQGEDGRKVGYDMSGMLYDPIFQKITFCAFIPPFYGDTLLFRFSPSLPLSLFFSPFLPPFLFRSLFLPRRLSFYLILFSLMSLSLITTTLLLSSSLFLSSPDTSPLRALVNLAYTYVRSPRCICILRNRPFDFTPGLFDPQAEI